MNRYNDWNLLQNNIGRGDVDEDVDEIILA